MAYYARGHYATGVVVSVLMHLALLAGLLPAVFAPKAEPAREHERSIAVSLVFTKPTVSVAEPGRAASSDLPVQADATDPIETKTVARTANSANGVMPSVPGEARSSMETEAQDTPSPSGMLSATDVRVAITAFVQRQHGERTADFVEGCWLERQEHGPTHGCEGVRESGRSGNALARDQVDVLFLALTREQRHARLRTQLERREQQLQALQEKGGVTGKLATSLGVINREYLAYLGGNRNEAAYRYVMSAGGDGTNRALMDGFLQFICAEMPCI